MAEYFAYPLMMFLATPAFLLWLGQEQYGQWMLLLTFNGLGGLAGLGMGAAATRDVAAARGRGDMSEAVIAVQAAFSVSVISGFVVSALLLVASETAGPQILQRVGEPDIVRFIIAAAALLIWVEQVDTVFTGVVRGLERFGLAARVEALAKAMLVLAALAAAFFTRDVRWVIAATFAATALRLIIKFSLAARLLGRIPRPSGNREQMTKVFAFGKWTWAQSLGSALFSTADRFLVGTMLGAEALARYSLCIQLAQQVHTIPSAGAQFLFPAISRRREAGEGYRNLAMKGSLAIGALGIALSLLLAIFADPILRVWVGSEIAESSAGILQLLAVAFAILAVNVGPFFVLLASGRERSVAVLTLTAGLAAIAVAWTSIEWTGLIGAAIGRLAYAMLTLAGLPQLMRRTLTHK